MMVDFRLTIFDCKSGNVYTENWELKAENFLQSIGNRQSPIGNSRTTA